MTYEAALPLVCAALAIIYTHGIIALLREHRRGIEDLRRRISELREQLGHHNKQHLSRLEEDITWNAKDIANTARALAAQERRATSLPTARVVKR